MGTSQDHTDYFKLSILHPKAVSLTVTNTKIINYDDCLDSASIANQSTAWEPFHFKENFKTLNNHVRTQQLPLNDQLQLEQLEGLHSEIPPPPHDYPY